MSFSLHMACMASASPPSGNVRVFFVWQWHIGFSKLKRSLHSRTPAVYASCSMNAQCTLLIRFDVVYRDRLLRAPLSCKRNVLRSNTRNAKPCAHLTRGLPVPLVISRLSRSSRRSRRTAVRSCSHTEANSTGSYHTPWVGAKQRVGLTDWLTGACPMSHSAPPIAPSSSTPAAAPASTASLKPAAVATNAISGAADGRDAATPTSTSPGLGDTANGTRMGRKLDASAPTFKPSFGGGLQQQQPSTSRGRSEASSGATIAAGAGGSGGVQVG